MDPEHPHHHNKLEGYLRRFAPPQPDSGAALLILIVSLVILSALGTTMVALTSTEAMNPLSANASARAYYLAEAGFRYAAAKYLQGAAMMDNLNAQTFAVGADQNFTLEFRPHLFEVTGGNGTQILETRVAFGFAPALVVPSPGPGYLKVGGRAAEVFDGIVVPDPNGNLIRFVKNTGTWTASTGETVTIAALSDGTTPAEGGDLNLQAGGAVDVFPVFNGRFIADGKTYRYSQRELNRLSGVYRVDGAWQSPALSSGDEIELQPYLELRTVGAYGSGTVATTREITYHVPIQTGDGMSQPFHEPFDDTDNWNPSTLGSHAVVLADGDNALQVTGTHRIPSTQLDTSSISLDWSHAGVDLAGAWSDGGNLLSYDAQVKIKVENNLYFMAGISFRLNSDQNFYGVSFLKSAPDNADGIWDDLVPVAGQPMVVLWERNGSIWAGQTKWLAYRTLGPSDYVSRRTLYFDDDLEDGTVKWSAADSPWALITSDSHSATHCWSDSPGGNYARGIDRSIVTQSIDLSTSTAPLLSFWHHYDIVPNHDYGYVEISVSGGSWATLQRFQGNQGAWVNASMDLSAYAGQADVRIRFRLHSHRDNNTGDGWTIDDVTVFEEVLEWPTILVRVEEKVAETGSFVGQRVNDIRVYFGDTEAHGTANADPLDTDRLADPRNQVHWPPADVADTDATNDHFTLVQWNAEVDPSVERLGTGSEQDAIIRSNTLTTPSSGSFTQEEIALHTWGWSSTNTYFEDFALRLHGDSTAVAGFLPAVQVE